MWAFHSEINENLSPLKEHGATGTPTIVIFHEYTLLDKKNHTIVIRCGLAPPTEIMRVKRRIGMLTLTRIEVFTYGTTD